MKLEGKVWKFGDNINTDEIIPAKYLNTTDVNELASHCMEGTGREFAANVKKGDIIVAGENFGCGSSREHAPLAIKGCGVSCVIARSFARIFFRNCINIGLPILECSEAGKIDQEDTIEVELSKGTIKDITKNLFFNSRPFPALMEEIIKAGGLMEWIKGAADV